MTEFATALGERAMLLRRRLGLTQGEMSARVGRGDHSVIARVEAGAFGCLGVDVLAGLAEAAEEVGLDANWLLTGEQAAPVAAGRTCQGGYEVRVEPEGRGVRIHVEPKEVAAGEGR